MLAQRHSTIFFILIILFIIFLLLSFISPLFLIPSISISFLLAGPNYKLVIPFYFILILILGLKADYYFIGSFITAFIIIVIFIKNYFKNLSL
ncbi:hypothetical protein IC006_0046 [Sulfuracidifex tepidarius]|uniref:Uncharacterized protein n=1 Tax=Sulfuracidifex tepidarius TaxID=1294262 RepID=A0A510DZ79_9CREN|nr:hypothetical protein IC006_0046 [Sulfuracidifex tepidarius]BBG25541.1 hypothetical protein IC007_0046 [Sulfuracidifex tepidarius]